MRDVELRRQLVPDAVREPDAGVRERKDREPRREHAVHARRDVIGVARAMGEVSAQDPESLQAERVHERPVLERQYPLHRVVHRPHPGGSPKPPRGVLRQ